MKKFLKTMAVGLAVMCVGFGGALIMIWLVSAFPTVIFALIILLMAYFFGTQVIDLHIFREKRDDSHD